MKAMVCLQSWAGYTEHPVEIIGETPTRYRVRALESFKLPRRWIHKGLCAGALWLLADAVPVWPQSSAIARWSVPA